MSSNQHPGQNFRAELSRAIDRGLDYLHQRQFQSGEFCSYRGTDQAMQGPMAPDGCVFPTALVAGCLLFLVNDARADEMLNSAAKFFLDQMVPGGLWHHFIHGNILRPLCAADADDTSCVAHVLRERGVSYPHTSTVPLLLANRTRGGLFYTWFVTRLQWNSSFAYWRLTLPEWRHPRRNVRFWRTVEGGRLAVDGIVNANVLHYLGVRRETQPVIAYLLRIIAEGKEADCDLWYHNNQTLYYFLSRNYHRGIAELEPARQLVIDRILAARKPDGRLGETVLDTALGICSLLNWHASPAELESACRFLLRHQQSSGEWPRWFVYYGGPSKQIGWGSEETTTGFCLEALARYRDLLSAGADRAGEAVFSRV